jgi:transcriptional regulator with XRE-family HTH domain
MNSSHQVKQLRLQRAWSQEQLAELAGSASARSSALRMANARGWRRSALAAVFEVDGGRDRRRIAARATKPRWICV